MKKYLLLLFVLSLAVSACTSQNSSEALPGSWTLTSYGPAGAPVLAVADSGAQLTFNEDGTVTGNSGCNGFSGDYTVEANEITFGQIVSTLMACEDARMQQEEAVHRVLTDTATYEIEGNTLTLTNNDMVLVFSK
ncbi:MAG TPA: META domain-containing protein [Anaerolineales bacterium]|nr:META domain-containing protein [Anaerolineales bacterium]